MPQILVEAQRVAPTTGTTILDKEIIEKLPTRNGSVNEIIGVVPGVQYSEEYNSSYTGGEITPPMVSVSGSRFYENNFTIDGISNNSSLDPASDSIADANKLPGHPQMLFLNPRLIEQVTVFNSNIPAEFGGFTGGLVNTRTVSPSAYFQGEISYRTTNDNWTDFHIHPLKEDDFNSAANSRYQPEFTKHDFGLILNTPLGSDTAVITSYQQLYSRIPFQNLDDTTISTRKRENFFLKLEHFLPGNAFLTLTGLYSPTNADYFLEGAKNSNYRLKSDNFLIGAEFEKDFISGKLLLNLGLAGQISKRSAPDNRYFWSTQTESIDWETGREGGLGDIENRQLDQSITASYTLTPIETGTINHHVKTGIELTRSRQSYRRDHASYSYYSPVLDATVSCADNDPACIDGQQYLSKRTKYSSAQSLNHVTDVAAYFQDSMAWYRLEVFPGMRVSYDDFTEQTNVAPRLSCSLDIFGNGNTILFTGKNRYYSGTLLTQALYDSVVTENQTRESAENNETSWTGSPVFLFKNNQVETPYTDEATVGIIQKVFGGEFKAQYIKKISKKEFARQRISNPDPEPDTYLLINSGRSEHESYQLSWQRFWSRHFLELNITWQETTTTNDDYDNTFTYEELSETIWYDGEELYKYEIPRLDFNRPTVGNLIYSYQLPYGITFTNTTKYRGSYWRLSNTGSKRPSEDNPDQPDPFIYEKKKTHSAVIFDWNISWSVPYFSKNELIVSLDIFNVFNKRVKRGYQSGNYGYNYEIGRQIWAGVDLVF